MPAKRTSGHIIQDEGTSLAQGAFLNFVGSGVSAATASGKTTVTIPVSSFDYESRGSNTILGVADKGKTIVITAAITQTFEADETLGDGWWVILRNSNAHGSNSVVTLDPAGTETIDGLTTFPMWPGEERLILCNGAGGNFNSIMLSPGVLYVETTSNTTISATTEAGATVIAVTASVGFDGNPVWAQVFAPLAEPPSQAGSSLVFLIEIDDTSQGFMWQEFKDNSSLFDKGHAGVFAQQKVTPSAASHTLGWSAYKAGAATATVYAGAAGAGAYTPAYLQVTKI